MLRGPSRKQGFVASSGTDSGLQSMLGHISGHPKNTVKSDSENTYFGKSREREFLEILDICAFRRKIAISFASYKILT